MLVYLDASVWVKRYVIEEGSKRMRRWFQEGPLVATSPLALIEVMCTLVRKKRAGELEAAKMETSLDTAEEDFERFASVPLSSDLTNLARLLSRRYGLRGGDTLHPGPVSGRACLNRPGRRECWTLEVRVYRRAGSARNSLRHRDAGGAQGAGGGGAGGAQ